MRSAKVLSIFWHNVEASSVSRDGANPTVHVFREHIEFLLKNYTPISIFEFLQIREQKRFSHSYTKPPLLLGFDDGFKNIIRYALPVLEELGVPAVFFVLGEVVKNPTFVPWYVERKHLIRKTIKETVVYGNRRINLGVPGGTRQLMSLFDGSFRACRSEAERHALLTSFAEILDVARPQATGLDEDLQFVNSTDLASLTSSSLLTVASHAMTHRDLGKLSYDEQMAELEESDSLLRRYCPSYFPVIAYPNGSFNGDTVGIAKRIYKAGFAVLLGASYRNLYKYPRIGLRDNSLPEVMYLTSAKRRNYLLPLKRVLHVTGIRPI